MRRVRDGFWAGLHLISHHERTMSNLAHAWVMIWYTGSALAVTFHVGHVHPLLGPLTCSLYGGEYMLKGGRGAWVTVFLCVGECKIFRLFC